MALSRESLGMRLAAARVLAALAVGIAAGQFLSGWGWVAGLAVVVGVGAAFFTRGMTLYLALAGAGALLGGARVPAQVPDQLFEGRRFSGIVVEEPVGFRQNRMVVWLSGPAGGKVTVWLRDSLPRVRYGDRVEVRARVRPLSLPRNPGVVNLNTVLKRRGYIGETSVRPGRVRVLGRGSGNPLIRLVIAPVRRYVYRTASALVPGPAGALLVGLMLGDRRGLPEPVQVAFVEGGVVHVLAVSGLHVGVIVAGVWLLLAVLRVRGWFRFGLTAAAAGLYVILVGGAAAPARAGLMACAALLSVPTQRRVSHVAGLCSAGIVLLLADPLALFDIGAQLSFAATLAIVLLVPVSDRLRRRMGPTPSLQKWVLGPLAVSLAASLGTAPLLLLHFGRVQPLAFLASVLVVPAASLGLLVGFLTVGVSLVWPGLAGVMAQSLELLLNGLLLLTTGLGRLDVAMWEPGRIGWPVVFWLCGLGLLALGWRRKWNRTALRIALAAGLAVLVWQSALVRPETRLTFLDPGRGDAVLLEDTLGRRVLFDAGIDGTHVLRDFLRARGIRRLDAVVVTHPDRDHYGGLADLGPAVHVGRLLVPTVESGDSAYNALVRRLEQRGTEVTTVGVGTTLVGLGFGIRFTQPGPAMRALYERGMASTNSVSLVARVEHGGRVMLLTGDMDAPEELTAEPVWLVKSPHHGSRKGNPPELYRALRPEFVVTMGRYPTPAGLEEWLAGQGAGDINTRRDGGIVLRFGKAGPVFSRD